MAITKPPVLPAWADAGDKVQPSNAELSVGWPVSSTPPSRQRFNWALNFVANAVRYFSRRGLVDYDVAETYMIGDCVIGDDGKTYRSLIDTNLAQTPSTQPTKWERWGFRLSELGSNAQTQVTTAFTTAGTAPNFVLTPSPALTAYTANQRFRVKFNVAGTGGDAINVSALGNKSLKQYDRTGSKVPAAIVAGQLADIEYDGVDFVVLDPLPDGSAGTVIFHSSTSAPAGYLKANGALISRTTYAALFAVIGTTYSVGDGATTFGLPDLRGEFLRGLDDSRGVDTSRTIGSAQAGMIKIPDGIIVRVGSFAGTDGSYDSTGVSTIPNVNDMNQTPYGNSSTAYTETRPRNVALLACIKY